MSEKANVRILGFPISDGIVEVLQSLCLFYCRELIHFIEHLGDIFHQHKKKVVLVLPPPITKG